MKPYPAYKPSGVQWLGDVPAHWEVKRLSFLAMLQSGENITSEMIAEGGDYPVYGGNGYRGNYNQFTHSGHFALIGRQGALCGNINYAKGEFWASEHALVVTPLVNFDVTWIGELLRAMNLGQYSVTAAQPGISAEVIRSLRIPVPPPTEQTAIATYLDRETARIDELVGKKRELIERLKEKRSALISRTVTRGLPADLPPDTLARLEEIAGEKLPICSNLKPSGHPWVKDIPAHWKLERLKYVSTLFGRIGFRGYSTEDLVLEREGAISMSPSNMVDGEIQLGKCTWLSWEKYHESPEIKIDQNDVVMVKTGSTLGKVAYVKSIPHPMTINPQLMIFKQVSCSRRFLFYFLVSTVVQDVIPLHNTGSTIPTMTQEGIGKLPLPLPPPPEQRAIAAYLDEETAKLDALVSKVETAIERLQEYRTSLITAAVTGKVDVRI